MSSYFHVLFLCCEADASPSPAFELDCPTLYCEYRAVAVLVHFLMLTPFSSVLYNPRPSMFIHLPRKAIQEMDAEVAKATLLLLTSSIDNMHITVKADSEADSVRKDLKSKASGVESSGADGDGWDSDEFTGTRAFRADSSFTFSEVSTQPSTPESARQKVEAKDDRLRHFFRQGGHLPPGTFKLSTPSRCCTCFRKLIFFVFLQSSSYPQGRGRQLPLLVV